MVWSKSRRLTSFACRWARAAGLLLIGAAVLWAQPTPPAGQRGKAARGFHVGGGFNVSDIETINMVTGNVMLRIPLASLPPGRGGSAFTLDLLYNSQIWDVEPELHQSSETETELRHRLVRSSEGGWRYGFEYGLEMEYRHGVTGGVECTTNHFAHYAYKMRVHFPDGSAHLLRLMNTQDTQGDNRGDGFYAYSPTGRRGPCPTQGVDIAGDVRYVTTDGAFAHVTLHRGTGNWTKWRWTIHFNDGRRVRGKRDQTEQLIDRNGNTIRVEHRSNCRHGSDSGLDCTILRDDAGREIEIVSVRESGGENEPDKVFDIVRAPGHGGRLEWQLDRGSVDMSAGEYSWGDSSRSAPDVSTIDKIKLPQLEGRQRLEYVFEYHGPTTAFGELKKVHFPKAADAAAGSAGSVTYSYRDKQNKWTDLLENPIVSKVVAYTEPLTSRALSETWRYSIDSRNVSTVTAPDGGVTRTYFYEEDGVASSSADAWKAGLVWKVEQPNRDKVERYWGKNQAYRHSPVIHPSDAGNPYVRAEYRTQGTKTAARAMTRDKNGNVLTAAEYDFGVTVRRDRAGIPNGAPTGTPVRTAVNAYTRATSNAGYTLDDVDGYWRAPAAAAATGGTPPPRLLSLTDYSEVRSGSASGTVQAKTDYTYDARGNATRVTRGVARGVSSATATTRHTYDAHGNLTQTTDARGNSVKLTYAAISGCPGARAANGSRGADVSVSNLYPTKREEAYNRTEERTTDYAYDCKSGLLTSETDDDNSSRDDKVVTTYEYDRLGRVTEVGEAGMRKTKTKYNDSDRRVYEERDRLRPNDARLAAARHYDPLGRLWLERTNDTGKASESGESSGIQVRRGYRYSGSNRYELASNPYRNTTEETMGWTRTKYDRNGRAVEAAAFAGGGRPSPWGSNGSGMGRTTTTYSNNTVTVRDAAGVTRTSAYDGLGRLVRVSENSVNTCYEYDAADNLTRVRQNASVSSSGACTGGQLRTFAYDKLGRLTSAANPENGTVSYAYDGNGNVLTKRDGRGGTVTHTYDALNRVKTTSYSGGGTDFAGTPGVTYTYDAGSSAGCKNKGRLTSVAGAGVSTTSYGCYDKLGRVTASTQTTTGDAARTFAYEYNADGTLKTQTYPSGLKVAYEYDEAGRPKAVGKNTVGAKEYAAEMAYAAHGGLRTMKLGNGLYESRGYNARMQPTAIRLGTSTSETERANKLSLGFDYGTTANNGNVLRQTIGREGMSGTLTQHYRYDGANRLGLASEGGTAPTGASGCPTTAAWCRDYSYDAYGNRAVTGVRGHTLPAAAPSAVSAFSTATNRMTAGSYDGVGNLTSLTGVGRLGYDAENRLKTYDNAVASLQEQGTYFYDGLGQRVKRTTNVRGTSETTVYVYDAFGQLAAEYSSKAPAAGSGGRFFITQDHLGSTRLVTKQDKKFAECRDFFPFGERIASGQNGRSLGCYGGDAVKQQFTGKERDPESSLDYFGARYYSARLGRFTGVDPANAGADPLVPQGWNGYAYAINNPLAFIDPTGLSWRRNNEAVTWTDNACEDGDSDCFDTLAVVNYNGEGGSTGITVYGSGGSDDKKTYNGRLINARTISENHPSDSAFEVKPDNKGEDFLSPSRAAALFNAAADYRGEHPGDSRLVMTGGSTAMGVSGIEGRTSHRGGMNIDMLYMSPKGRPLRGGSASKYADVERMNFLFGAFRNQNAGLESAVTGTPTRFGLRPHSLTKKHMNHVHFQMKYPK